VSRVGPKNGVLDGVGSPVGRVQFWGFGYCGVFQRVHSAKTHSIPVRNVDDKISICAVHIWTPYLLSKDVYVHYT